MIQVRRGVFETNSSSTHTLVLCDITDFEKFICGEMLFADYCNKLVTKEEAYQHYVRDECNTDKSREAFEKYLESEVNYDYITYDNWLDYNDDLEYFERRYTTKNGEQVVAFGFHGYH